MFAVLRQTLVHDGGEVLCHATVQRAHRRRLVLHDLPHDLNRRAAVERRSQGEHLVQRGAQAVDVDARVEVLLAKRLLRRHVRGRADGVAAHRQADRRLVARQTEVDEHRPAVLAQQHVRRLEIAVNDLRVMRHRQRVGQVSDDGSA